MGSKIKGKTTVNIEKDSLFSIFRTLCFSAQYLANKLFLFNFAESCLHVSDTFIVPLKMPL